MVVWVIVYLAIFKGVKSSSYIVWVTVPLPIIIIIVFVIKGLSLEGHKEGIKQYIQGNPASKYLTG
jgi:SNF family Na+-dependent transporter